MHTRIFFCTSRSTLHPCLPCFTFSEADLHGPQEVALALASLVWQTGSPDRRSEKELGVRLGVYSEPLPCINALDCLYFSPKTFYKTLLCSGKLLLPPFSFRPKDGSQHYYYQPQGITLSLYPVTSLQIKLQYTLY